jgi:hypothetical protein
MCDRLIAGVATDSLVSYKINYLNSNDEHAKSLLNDIEEIVKLLISIVKSSQEIK